MSDNRKEAAQTEEALNVIENTEDIESAELSDDDLEKVAGGAGAVSYEIVQGNRGPQAGN